MLNINNIIQVSVTEAPQGAEEPNVNNVLLATTDQFLSNNDGDEYRSYVSAAAVGSDFGTTTETYKQAVAFFSQVPNALNGGGALIIAPTNNTSSGVITGVSIDTVGSGYAVNDVLTLAGGTDGSVKVTAIDDDGAVLTVVLYNGGTGYSVASGVATTPVPSGGTGCTIDIDTITNAETLLNLVARISALVFFVGILSTFYPSGADRKTLADSIQAYGDKIFMLASATYADIAGVFTDIKDAGDYATRCLYYSTAALDARLFAAAYAGRGFSTNFDAVNGTGTMNLKALKTIDPDEALTQAQKDAAGTAGVDVYANIAGQPCVVSNGANEYFDEVYNLIWFVGALKVAGFNSLRQTSGKVPQTEAGMTVLKSAYRGVCELARANAYLAPGTWNSPDTFGNQEAFVANVEQFGYYIYSAPVSQQSESDREARKAPLVQIAIKEAGAIQSSSVIVEINP